jgi:hypothetical protein
MVRRVAVREASNELRISWRTPVCENSAFNIGKGFAEGLAVLYARRNDFLKDLADGVKQWPHTHAQNPNGEESQADCHRCQVEPLFKLFLRAEPSGLAGQGVTEGKS